MNLEKALKEYSDCLDNIKKERQAAENLRRLIREKVVEGESTGDRIRDFVISITGLPDAELEAAYRRLDEKIGGKKGKQVLFVEETETEGDFIKFCVDSGREEGLMPRPRHMQKTEALKLGVLLEDRLVFDLAKSKIVFPVEKYVFQFERGCKWALVEGPVRFDATEILLLDEKTIEEYKKKRSIVSGFMFGAPARSEKLSLYLDEEVENYFSEPRPDLSYIDGLHLLGIGVPKRFQEEQARQACEAKEGVLHGIDLVLKEGEVSLTPGNKAYGRMRAVLDKAIALGMHKDESVVPGKQKGVQIKVSEYIIELCRRYSVKIPE